MIRAVGKKSLGRRENQQDAFKIVFKDEKDPRSDVLMVLSDGMGGHAGGEVASQLAVEHFAAHFTNGASATRPRPRLQESLDQANAAIARHVQDHPDLAGMGCTLIGALSLGDRLVWISVGDSILFLVRDGQISRMNADHSLYGELLELVQAGKLSQREADTHPRRNALRSALMGEAIALTDINAVELHKGDMVLLASDGIETLSDPEILAVLSSETSGDIRAMTSELLNAVEAKGRSNQDNTSVVLYRHAGLGGTSVFGESGWSGTDTSDGMSPRRRLALIGAGIAALALVVLALSLGSGVDPDTPAPGGTELRGDAVEDAGGTSTGEDRAIANEDTPPDAVDGGTGDRATEDSAPDIDETPAVEEPATDTVPAAPPEDTGDAPATGDAEPPVDPGAPQPDTPPTEAPPPQPAENGSVSSEDGDAPVPVPQEQEN